MLDAGSTSTSSARRRGCAPRRGAGAYRAALALYAGELLPENRYDDWADVRRAGAAHDALVDGAPPRRRPPPGPPAATSSFVGRTQSQWSLLATHAVAHLSGTKRRGQDAARARARARVERHYASGAVIVELAAVSDPRLVRPPSPLARPRDSSRQELIDALVDFLAPRGFPLVMDARARFGTSATLVDDCFAPRGADRRDERSRYAGRGGRLPGAIARHPRSAGHARRTSCSASRPSGLRRPGPRAPDFALARTTPPMWPDCVRPRRPAARARWPPAAPGLSGSRGRAVDDRTASSRAQPHRADAAADAQATLQWSHDLLEEDERLLFRHLAVSPAAWLGAVEAGAPVTD